MLEAPAAAASRRPLAGVIRSWSDRAAVHAGGSRQRPTALLGKHGSFRHVATPSIAGFSPDDVTFGQVSGVPAAAAGWLRLVGLLALAERQCATPLAK
jgi:hypothetical protein